MVMNQASALRRLEEILDEAVSKKSGNDLAGGALLDVMKLKREPRNIVDVYELFNRAEEEARKIKNIPKIYRQIKTFEELYEYFLTNHLWSGAWANFAAHIQNLKALDAIDTLAHHYQNQNPSIDLEKDCLDKLNDEFRELLNDVTNSDLSKDLKIFLAEQLEDILRALCRYHIDGIKGLQKVSKSFIGEVVISENKFDLRDKNNPTYRKVMSWAVWVLIFIRPSSVYDIIGAVPDINGFWVPKIEELVSGQKKIETIISETPTIHDSYLKALNTFSRQPQKIIEGSTDPKALPYSKDNLQTTKEN
jgi:hypothetical protein